MTKTIISDRPRLIPIYEFEHHSRIEKNTAYAINKVNNVISRGQTTIELDEKKLNHKVFKGTSCYMFNRLGEPMTIAYNKSIESRENHANYIISMKASTVDFKVVEGYSRPQHGDKFARYEGRMNALRNAYSAMKLLRTDPNFEDLLTVKRFINTYELETNCTTVSYQFMDLWLAVLSGNDDAIVEAGKNYVGLDTYTEWFADCLVAFNEIVTQFESSEGRLNTVDKYTLFKSYIKRCNSNLF